MQRLSKTELTALLTVLGISTGAIANAAPTSTSHEKPFLVAEKEGAKKGAEMACGKGACGTDDKGAAAAKEKSAEKKSEAKKGSDKKAEVKTK